MQNPLTLKSAKHGSLTSIWSKALCLLWLTAFGVSINAAPMSYSFNGTSIAQGAGTLDLDVAGASLLTPIFGTNVSGGDDGTFVGTWTSFRLVFLDGAEDDEVEISYTVFGTAAPTGIENISIFSSTDALSNLEDSWFKFVDAGGPFTLITDNPETAVPVPPIAALFALGLLGMAARRKSPRRV